MMSDENGNSGDSPVVPRSNAGVQEAVYQPKVQRMLETKAAKASILKARAAALILNGMTQSAAAERVGVSEATISQWKKSDPLFKQALDRHDLVAAIEETSRRQLDEQIDAQEVANLALLRFELQGLVHDSIRELHRTILKEDTSDKDRIAAIREVFDRTGLIKNSEITVKGQKAAAVSDENLADAFVLLGVSPEEMARARKSLPSEIVIEPEAQGDGDGK